MEIGAPCSSLNTGVQLIWCLEIHFRTACFRVVCHAAGSIFDVASYQPHMGKTHCYSCVVVYGQKLFIHLSPLITGSILCWCVGQKKVSSSKLDDLKTKFEAVQIFKFKTSPDKNQRIFGTAPKNMSPYWLPITMVFENFGWCEYCNLGRGCVLMVPVGAWEWMAELAKPSVGSNLWCTGTRFPKRYGRLYTMAYSLDISKH